MSQRQHSPPADRDDITVDAEPNRQCTDCLDRLGDGHQSRAMNAQYIDPLTPLRDDVEGEDR